MYQLYFNLKKANLSHTSLLAPELAASKGLHLECRAHLKVTGMKTKGKNCPPRVEQLFQGKSSNAREDDTYKLLQKA